MGVRPKAAVVAKLFALYPQQYFISSWNRFDFIVVMQYCISSWNKFDFIVVMVSFAGILIDHLGSAIDLNPTILRVLRIVRIFRILRAFRIFKAAQGLQNLVRTLTRSLGAVTNLGTLLILLFFVAGVFCLEDANF
ncbi:Ion transport protein-domain-containing protein [Baffinella frigidus]|nr:Ion transport protein-domain-containing protein [Cryptophyta sp. CCMP2293]